MAEEQTSKIDPLAVLSYLSFFCLIPLFSSKKDEFLKFHVQQGFVLFVLEILLGFVSLIPILGFIVWVFGGLFCLILSILGIINVVKGKKEELPVVGRYAKMIKI